MHLLNYGSFEAILASYTFFNYRGKSDRKELGNLAATLMSLSYNGTPDSDVTIDDSQASKCRTGKKPFPDKVMRAFHLPDARSTITNNATKDLLPFVERGRTKQLLNELSNLINQDTSLDESFKADLLQTASEEKLAELIADILMYIVTLDPNQKVIPTENYGLLLQNDWFTGREKELAEIEHNFNNEHHIQILYGVGGMGKTQLALKYAYEHYRSYSLIHWVDAHSVASITNSFMELMKAKKIKPFDQSVESICAAYLNYMESRADWLIVFDNCNYYTDAEFNLFLNLCIPKNPSVGNVLITTRSNRPIGKAVLKEVGVLSENDATDFIKNRTGIDDTDSSKKLADRLKGYALALEIAGAYIRATPGCDIGKYLYYLDHNPILDEKINLTEYEHTIREVILLTIEKIKEDRNNDELSLCIEDILHLCAYCDPDNIDLEAYSHLNSRNVLTYIPKSKPTHDFDIDIAISQNKLVPQCDFVDDSEKKADEARLSRVINFCSNEIELNRLVWTLLRYGLLSVGSDDSMHIHAVQQEVLRDYIFENDHWSAYASTAFELKHMDIQLSFFNFLGLKKKAEIQESVNAGKMMLMKNEPNIHAADKYLYMYVESNSSTIPNSIRYYIGIEYRTRRIIFAKDNIVSTMAKDRPHSEFETEYKQLYDSLIDYCQYYFGIEDRFKNPDIFAVFIHGMKLILSFFNSVKDIHGALIVVSASLKAIIHYTDKIDMYELLKESVQSYPSPYGDVILFLDQLYNNISITLFLCLANKLHEDRIAPYLEKLIPILDAHAKFMKSFKRARFMKWSERDFGYIKKTIGAYISNDCSKLPAKGRQAINAINQKFNPTDSKNDSGHATSADNPDTKYGNLNSLLDLY